MSIDQGLAVLGIALAVFFGVIGIRAVTKHKQKQVVKGNSSVIQSGRDTKIGSK